MSDYIKILPETIDEESPITAERLTAIDEFIKSQAAKHLLLEPSKHRFEESIRLIFKSVDEISVHYNEGLQSAEVTVYSEGVGFSLSYKIMQDLAEVFGTQDIQVTYYHDDDYSCEVIFHITNITKSG